MASRLERLLDELRSNKALLVSILDKVEPDNLTKRAKLTTAKTYLDCTIAEVRSMIEAYVTPTH